MTRPPLSDYPWDLLDPVRERASAHPDGLVDLSVGSPVDATPPHIREALAAATEAPAYPPTVGIPDLRDAIVTWFTRRRGVPDLTRDHVLPTIGSKEFVGLLPFLLGLGPEDTVVHPETAYPTYAMGAALVGATAVAVDNPAQWPEGTRLIWLNSPGNPDGRVLDIEALRAAHERATALGAILVSDECYAELGWNAPWDSARIPSLLDPRVLGENRRNRLAMYSLSKQSNLAGYRAAFVGGCRAVIAELATVRKHAGLMVPGPVQRAMVAALGDDDHVARQRERYRHRRDILAPALMAAGFRIDHSEAGLYLWATEGRSAWESVERLAARGILAGPGVFYGDAGAGHVRLALTASDERVAAAVHRLHEGPLPA